MSVRRNFCGFTTCDRHDARVVAFSASLFRKYLVRRSLTWLVGDRGAFYGLGTLIEATITLAGKQRVPHEGVVHRRRHPRRYRSPQGSLYLSYSRRFANRATASSVPVVVIASLLVLLSPSFAALEAHRPSEPFWRGVVSCSPRSSIPTPRSS